MSELRPLKINPPLNVTLVEDGAGLDKIKSFLAKSNDKVIGWDKETPPIKDFYERRDRTWQIGDKNEQFVVDLLAFVDGNPTNLYDRQGSYGTKICSGLALVRDTFSPALCSDSFLKVGVNLGFEYEQSYWNFGMRAWNMFSCDMVERIIQAGAHSLKDYGYYSMEEMVARYFGMQVDKELQQSFNLSDPLTPQQIEYAALDTWVPLALRKRQLEIIKRDHLEEVSTIENNAIGAFIDMHVHGLNVNLEKWDGLVDKNKTELTRVVKEELDPVFLPVVGSKTDVISDEDIDKTKLAWKILTVPSDREKAYKKEARQCKDEEKKGLLLTNVARLEAERKAKKDELKKVASELSKRRTKQRNLVAKCEGDALINYASNAQLYDVLVTLPGLKELKGTEDDELKDFKDVPVIKSVRAYRGLSKKVKTYGKTWTTEWSTSPGFKKEGMPQEGWLHPGDGRLHSKFNQLDAETGRSTSSQPNDQNIPHDPETRSCFEADPPNASIRISDCCEADTELKFNNGNGAYVCTKCRAICTTHAEEYVIVTADMAGAELRILAELADEKIWIDAFNRGEDVHEVCAEIMYPVDWPKWTEPGCKYYALKADGTPAHQKCKCSIHKVKRDDSKVPNFLIPYGGGAPNLAAQTDKPLKEAEEIMKKHETSFPTLHAYLERSGKQARIEGESRDMFDRRRIFLEPTWDRAKAQILEDMLEEDSMWEKKMRISPLECGFSKFKWTPSMWEKAVNQVIEDFLAGNGRKPLKQELFDLVHKKEPIPKDISFQMTLMDGRIERQGKNHRIQGTNATIAKLAMGCGFDKNGKPFLWHTLPQYMAKLLAFVHDELLIQCPKRFGKIVAALVGDAFKRAAAEKMTKVTMEFDYHIEKCWTK